jgi:hypothetical protein
MLAQADLLFSRAWEIKTALPGYDSREANALSLLRFRQLVSKRVDECVPSTYDYTARDGGKYD